MSSIAHATTDAATPAIAPVIAAPSAPAVALAGVTRTFGRREGAVRALDGVSLHFAAGTLTAIMGPSGSGKTTLLLCAAGLEQPDRGVVRIGATELGSLSERRRARLRRERVGFVFQRYNLLPSLTAAQNVVLPLRLAGRHPRSRIADEALQRVGLRDHARRRPAELSGGQQQRVAIARALVAAPEVIFADEPTGALDSASAREVLALLRAASDHDGRTIIMVTHDPVAAAIADRVVFLADGRVVGEHAMPDAETVGQRMTALGGVTVVGRVVRLRGGSLIGALVIIAVGATIAAGAGQIMATALGAPGPGRFAAATAVVRADPSFRLGGADGETITVRRSPRLPVSDVARIAAIPGVSSVVGDVAFPVAIAGLRGGPLRSRGGVPVHGHGWDSAALTPYRLIRGRPPVGLKDVVFDAALARAGRLRVGQRVRISAPAGAAWFRLSGVAVAPGPIRRKMSSVFFAPARAGTLSGLGAGVDAIAVRSKRGTSTAALRARLATTVGAGATVLDHRHASAADAGDPRAGDRTALVAVLASGAGLTLGIAMLVVAGTITFAVQGRRRDIATLRIAGATPGQVRRALIGRSAVAGVAGGALGCGAATALMGVFVHALIAVDLAPHGFSVSPNWIPYGIALASGPVVAAAAALGASRRALSRTPGDALVETALPPRRMGILRSGAGLLALGGGVALLVTLSHQALDFATLDACCFMIAVALLGPVVIGGLGAVAARPLRAAGASGFLAGSALGSGRFRVAAAGTGVALVVALVGTQVVALATAQQATRHVTAQRVRGDHVLVAGGGAGLPPAADRAAARLPGARTTAMTQTEVYLLDHHLTNDGDSWQAAGLGPAPAPATLDLGVRQGSLRAVGGHAIAVSHTLATDGHVGVGDALHARLADGTPATLRIAAVYDRSAGLGDVVLPAALARSHAAAAVDDVVFVAGGDRGQLARGLHAIARAIPGAAVISRRAYLGQARAADRQDADAQWVIDALMVVVTVLAAFNAGATAVAQRRPELGLARLTGASSGQLARALTLESLVTTGAGIAIGAAVALMCFARAGDDPSAGPLTVPLGQAALVIGGAALLGIAGQLVPAALARRVSLGEIAAAGEP